MFETEYQGDFDMMDYQEGDCEAFSSWASQDDDDDDDDDMEDSDDD